MGKGRFRGVEGKVVGVGTDSTREQHVNALVQVWLMVQHCEMKSKFKFTRPDTV